MLREALAGTSKRKRKRTSASTVALADLAVDATPSTSDFHPVSVDTPSLIPECADEDMTPTSGSPCIADPPPIPQTPCSSLASEATCSGMSGNSDPVVVDCTPSGSGLQHSSLKSREECRKCKNSERKIKSLQKKHNRLEKRFISLEEQYNELLVEQVGSILQITLLYSASYTVQFYLSYI